MKTLFNFRVLTALLAMLFALGTTAGISAQTRTVKRKPVIRRTTVRRATPTAVKPTVKLYSVQRGQTFRVRMNETINSKTARVGDRFTTTVTEPVYSDTGVIVIPVGSTVVGRIDSVKPAKNGGDPGSIDASFVEVKLPNGTRRAINGSLTDLNSKNATSDVEGTAKGNNISHRKVVFIGGGAGGGAILGGLVGGGKGALIGGILGGLGGFAGEKLTKGKEAEVVSGTEFGVYLNRAISMPKFP